MTARTSVAVVSLVLGVACGSATPPAAPPPLRVFSSNGVRALLEELRSRLESDAGRPVDFEFSTTTNLQRRIEAGDTPDIAVLTTAAIESLAKRGALATASQTPVARVGVGVAVRANAPTADVSTPDALKALLMGARSVTYTAEGQSRPAIDNAFAQLGIVDAMKDKTVLRGPAEPAGAVARGESDIVITLLSELVGEPGVKVLGPLPAPLQRYVAFAAARPETAGSEVDSLLHALASVDVALLAKHGLEPVASR